MKFNFDDLIDRKNSFCEKFDGLNRKFGTEDIFPMWVADMDFTAPNSIVDALNSRVNHSIFAYPTVDSEYIDSIIKWQNRYGYEIQKDWILFSPSVVTSLNLAIKSFTKKGDKIIIQSPIYPPFFNTILNHKRVVFESKVNLVNDKYQFKMQKNLKSSKMLFLCNPHNPTGRVFTRDELIEIGEFCLKHNIIIISDEIHSDIIYSGYKHTPIASISNEFADITVTLNSASKSFNIAGLNNSYVIIKNRELRSKFLKEIKKLSLAPNIFGMLATKEAYTNSIEWLTNLNIYLESNLDLVDSFLKKNLSKIELIRPEATYLLWLNFNKLGLSHSEVKRKLLYEVKVGFNDGIEFRGDECFFRMNIATSKANILNILNKMRDVFE